MRIAISQFSVDYRRRWNIDSGLHIRRLDLRLASVTAFADNPLVAGDFLLDDVLRQLVSSSHLGATRDPLGPRNVAEKVAFAIGWLDMLLAFCAWPWHTDILARAIVTGLRNGLCRLDQVADEIAPAGAAVLAFAAKKKKLYYWPKK